MRIFFSCLLTALALLPLTACERETAEEVMAQATAEESIVDPMGGDSGETVETVAMTDPTLSGSYLAMRHAMRGRDEAVIADFVAKGLALNPDEKVFQQAVFPAAMASGDYEKAIAAAKIVHDNDDLTSILADTLLIAEAIKTEDRAALRELVETLPSKGTARALKPFLQSWAAITIGDQTPEQIARTLLQRGSRIGITGLASIQAALILSLNDDPEAAARLYLNRITQAETLHSATLIGTILMQAGEEKRAKQVIAVLNQFLPTSESITALLKAIEANDRSAIHFPKTPSEGFAATLIDIATLVRNERAAGLARSLAQIALFAHPGNAYAKLILADIAVELEDYDIALKYYQSLADDPVLGVGATFETVALMLELDREGEVRDLLDTLAQRQDLPPVLHYRLGNSYRALEAHREALVQFTLYEEGLAAIERKPTWEFYYARGITHDALSDWSAAESDLKTSLDLDPKQPYVLNYLGYSWADRGENIEQALNYIKEAVRQRPSDGYIIDSLGWVYYKLGRYDEAVLELEKAVQLLPNDPVLNDHLGDVYWKLGRKDSARVQWRIALEAADGDDKEHERIRKEAPVKLDGKFTNIEEITNDRL